MGRPSQTARLFLDSYLVVFVSSIIAGLETERRAAQAAIEAIPLTRPWLFEFSPASSQPLDESYLRNVRGCDIFMLLLTKRLSDPVRAEVQTAQGEKKPLLVFVGDAAPDEVVAYALGEHASRPAARCARPSVRGDGRHPAVALGADQNG